MNKTGTSDGTATYGCIVNTLPNASMRPGLWLGWAESQQTRLEGNPALSSYWIPLLSMVVGFIALVMHLTQWYSADPQLSTWALPVCAHIGQLTLSGGAERGLAPMCSTAGVAARSAQPASASNGLARRKTDTSDSAAGQQAQVDATMLPERTSVTTSVFGHLQLLSSWRVLYYCAMICCAALDIACGLSIYMELIFVAQYAAVDFYTDPLVLLYILAAGVVKAMLTNGFAWRRWIHTFGMVRAQQSSTFSMKLSFAAHTCTMTCAEC